MEILHRSCCGIDVHKQFLVACLRTVDETGRPNQELHRFSTMTGELLTCVDWLQQAQCSAIAMESTGVYWQAPYNLMEGMFAQVMIVNAQHLKRVPGRKTDKKDAEWIAELLQVGLLNPSFIPPRFQRELRQLTRVRTTLGQERTRLINRLHKTLEDTKRTAEFGAHRSARANRTTYSGGGRARRRRSCGVGESGVETGEKQAR